MLEPLFGVFLEVALRSANIDKFTLVAQSIDHQVGKSRLILHDISQISLGNLTTGLIRSKFLLSLKVFCCNIVGLNLLPSK